METDFAVSYNLWVQSQWNYCHLFQLQPKQEQKLVQNNVQSIIFDIQYHLA